MYTQISISKSGIIFYELLMTQTTRGCICDALWWKTVSCCFCNIHIFKVSTSRRCLTRELGNTQGYPNVFASKTTLRQITWNCPGAGWSWRISVLYIDSLRICLDKIYTHVAALGLVPAHYCLSHRKDQRHTPQQLTELLRFKTFLESFWMVKNTCPVQAVGRGMADEGYDHWSGYPETKYPWQKAFSIWEAVELHGMPVFDISVFSFSSFPRSEEDQKQLPPYLLPLLQSSHLLKCTCSKCKVYFLLSLWANSLKYIWRVCLLGLDLENVE